MLFKQFPLQLRNLFGVVLVDESLDCILFFRLRVGERVIHGLRYLRFAILRALPVELREFANAHLSSEQFGVLLIVRLDLSRIAHMRLLFSGPTTVYKLTAMLIYTTSWRRQSLLEGPRFSADLKCRD